MSRNRINSSAVDAFYGTFRGNSNTVSTSFRSTAVDGKGKGIGGKGGNYGFGFDSPSANRISDHARRKQDEEILAELEADKIEGGAAIRAAEEAAEEEANSLLSSSASTSASARSREKAKKDASRSSGREGDGGGRNERKTHTTSLPREDAHRFRATMDEAVERLDLLGLITSDSLRRRKGPEGSGGGSGSAGGSAGSSSRARQKDIFTLMQRETDLEAQYEALMHRRNELRGLSNKSKYLANQSELSEITAALKASTTAITANLKDHPTILGNLQKIQKDRQGLQQLLQDAIEELKEETYSGAGAAAAAAQAAQAAEAAALAAAELAGGLGGDPSSTDGTTTPNGTLVPSAGAAGSEGADAPAAAPGAGGYTPSYSYDTLVDQVTRRSDEQRLLLETKLRQEKTAEALKKLELELDQEWAAFERLEDQKNAQIVELTNQLKHLKKVTLLTVKYQQQTAIAQKETLERQRASRLAELRAQIASVKLDLKTDKRVNKKSLVFLAKQKEAMDLLYEEWEHNYDVDHGAKSRQLEGLSRDRTNDQLVLVENQKRWDVDSAAKIALMEEIRVRSVEEEAYRALLDRMYLAQCTIRFAWRCYWRRRRKELKKLKRKKLARLRAAKKAENARPPSFGKKTDTAEAAAEGAATPAAAAASKPASSPASAKVSAR